VIDNVEDEAVGDLAIDGDAEEGGTLTADTSGLSDDDGIVSVAYQWQLDGANIDGATSDTLNIPDDESYVGHEVTLKVTTTDAFGGTTDFSTSTTIANINDAPSVSLINTLASTPENGGVVKVADIVIDDPDGGTNELSLSGADAESFTIVGNELRFNGGANFEVKDSYDVTVNVDDASVGGNPDDSEGLTLAISDVVETVPASLPSTFNGTGDTNDFDLLNSGSTNGSATGLTLTGSNNGSNGDTMHGSNANDSINAQNGPDVVYGHGGNDTILGGNQGDTVYGQVGNDSLSGGADPDFIYGGSGTDLINGDGQADVIYGGSGRDTINGGGGPDTITGGFGDDVIDLGDSDGASDTIAYIDVLDTNDSITGFVSGIDKIDLSAIDSGDGDGAFNWGGQEAGPVVEANSVTWYTTGGNVVVLADTDGNLNTAEFSITLVGITSIVDSDVIL
jgi:Ca2+-binding RTX toxin-like protein